MIKIDNQFISQTSEKAKNSARHRMNYNFHTKPDENIQRMLNALEPETYVRPHRHINPNKTEIFFVLRGKMVLIEFDDFGEITDYFVLDPLHGNFGCEVVAGVWHCLISLKSGSVAYEVKEGPFTPISDANFASWAPVDGIEASRYQNQLLARIGVSKLQ